MPYWDSPRKARAGDVGGPFMRTVREGLLGPSYFYHRQLIEKSKGWSAEEIRRYQEVRFRRLVRRYGDKITSKDDYRDQLSRYSRWDWAPLTHPVRTSGTSGQPFRFQADTFARRQKERAYLFDVWSRAGYKPFDLRLRYRGDIRRGDRPYHERMENVWVVSPAGTIGDELDRLRTWLPTLPPFFLHVYPSSLFSFIDLVGEELFRRLPVRGVLAGSETFPAEEQLRFEREFGIPIAHWYGHAEYAILAYCCRDCRGFHFYPTYGQVEFPPSEAEGCQRIVASSFNRVGTQFVRYDTGDLAMAPTGPCPADGFPVASAIVGRWQETFIDSSGRRRSLYGYGFGDLDHGSFWDQIRDIQFVQEGKGQLRLRLVTNPGADKVEIEQIFRGRIPMASLEFEFVSAIQRSSNGKRRYLVNALEEVE